MLRRLRHRVRVWKSRRRERKKEKRRAAGWNELRDWLIARCKRCAACGGGDELQVHHIWPVSMRPSLELEAENLIVLCMGPHECHLRIGHGGNWKRANPNVIADASLANRSPSSRVQAEYLAHELSVSEPKR